MNQSESLLAHEPSNREDALWAGDTGRLAEASRRALLELLRGPYLSGSRSPGLWRALIDDQAEIESRLNELFLELRIDPTDEIAFTRKVHAPEIQVPNALRTQPLAYLDTAMLLILRQLLLSSGERRVIVGQDEVYELLAIYRDGDESTFLSSLNGAWGRMVNKLRVLHPVGSDRAEISPVVKFLVDEDRVRAIIEVYREFQNNHPRRSINHGRSREDSASTDVNGSEPDAIGEDD